MQDQRGSAKAIAEIIKIGNKMSIDEMAVIAKNAEAAGGSIVAVDPDGNWCGNGVIRFKWPPKKNEFMEMLDSLVKNRINFEVLINGIPVEQEIVMQVSRKLAR